MYIYNSVDNSPTRVFQTSAALTGGAFTAVTLTENGVATSAAGGKPIGILAAETELPVAQGEDVNVVVCGGTLWTVGETIKAGDFLAAGAGGKAVKASDEFAFAQALENGAAGQAIRVLIVRANA